MKHPIKLMKISSNGTYFGRNIIVFALLLIVYYINLAFVIPTMGSLYDFGSFFAAGQLANEGKNPYSNQSPYIYSVKFDGNGLEGSAPNLNPPISVVIFQGITDINPYFSVNVWRVVSIALFIIGLIILHFGYPIRGIPAILRFVWAIGLAGFWHTIQLGQLYSLILLLTILTWALLKHNHPIFAGIFLGGLIAIKPNFIFWAFLLFIAGNWRIFLTSALIAASVSTIPLVTNGINIYHQWLEASSIFTANLILFPGNNSLQGLFARFGYAGIGIAISVILAIYLAWHVFKSHPSVMKINALGILGSLLFSPIAWTGYTLLVLPIYFEKKRWNWRHLLSAIIFSIPFAFPLYFFQTSFANFIIFGWFYGWGLLILLSEILIAPDIRVDVTAAITNNIQTN